MELLRDSRAHSGSKAARVPKRQRANQVRQTSAPRFCGASVLLLAALSHFACVVERREFVPPRHPDTVSDAAFPHYLAVLPIVTVDEAGRGLFLVLGPTTDWPTATSRLDELTQRGAIRTEWDLEPDDVLTFGTLGYMLQELLDLPKGINATVSRKTGIGERRYALATCVYEGVLPYRLPNEPVTGGELLFAMTEAEAYLEQAGADLP